MAANPTAVVILVLALLAIVVAYKGTQANFVAAFEGHPPANASTAKPSFADQVGSILTGSANRKLFGLP